MKPSVNYPSNSDSATITSILSCFLQIFVGFARTVRDQALNEHDQRHSSTILKIHLEIHI